MGLEKPKRRKLSNPPKLGQGISRRPPIRTLTANQRVDNLENRVLTLEQKVNALMAGRGPKAVQ